MTFENHSQFIDYISSKPFLLDSCPYLSQLISYDNISKVACCSGKKARYAKQTVSHYINIENMPQEEQNKLKETVGEEVVFLIDGREFFRII